MGEELKLKQGIYTPISTGNDPTGNQDTYIKTYEQLADAFKPELSAEEVERRKRAASSINGIANLGNVMSAFSNLVFTGKGAPSQTIPQVQGLDLQAYSDRAAKARQQYADAQARMRQMGVNDYNKAVDMYRAGVAANNNLENQKTREENDAVKFQAQEDQRKIRNDNAKKTLDLHQQQFEETKRNNAAGRAIQRENLEENKRYHDYIYNNGRWRGVNNNNKTNGINRVTDYDGNNYDFDTNLVERTIENTWMEVPEEIRNRYQTQLIMAGDNVKAINQVKMDAIGAWLNEDVTGEAARNLTRRGIIKPVGGGLPEGFGSGNREGNGNDNRKKLEL